MSILATTTSTVNTRVAIQSLSLFDADALSEAVRSSSLEHVQLEQGNFRAELKHINLGRLVIDSGCYTRKLIARGVFPAGNIILGCVLDSREEGSVNGYRFRHNDVVIFPEGAELDYIMPAATSWCAIQLTETLLEEVGCAGMRPNEIRVLPGNWYLAQLMGSLVNRRSPDSAAGVARTGLPPLANEENLLDQIGHVLNRYFGEDANVRRPSLHNRMSIIRQFEHKVRERIHTVIRIPELCTELGVSNRVLEYLVKDDIGMTPKQYVNVMRLNAVRRELLEINKKDRTILNIANRYGIKHLGRFAADYRRQFGELPSRTSR